MANKKSAARSVEDIADRFWSRVDKKEDGCWVWAGSRSNNYGTLTCRGISQMPLYSHRVAWELANGPIPAGRDVLHRCDNPPCCRPDHLFLGTQKDNNEDRQRKGRTASGNKNGARTKPDRNPFVRDGGSGLCGDRHPGAVLSDAQVCLLRERWAAGVYPTKTAAAKDFGISGTHVARIVNGRSRGAPH